MLSNSCLHSTSYFGTWTITIIQNYWSPFHELNQESLPQTKNSMNLKPIVLLDWYCDFPLHIAPQSKLPLQESKSLHYVSNIFKRSFLATEAQSSSVVNSETLSDIYIPKRYTIIHHQVNMAVILRKPWSLIFIGLSNKKSCFETR